MLLKHFIQTKEYQNFRTIALMMSFNKVVNLTTLKDTNVIRAYFYAKKDLIYHLTDNRKTRLVNAIALPKNPVQDAMIKAIFEDDLTKQAVTLTKVLVAERP